jgi:acyl carrier protein
MLSEERLKQVVAAMLGIEPGAVGPDTSTDTVEQWDSVRHMNLIIALEDAFGITIPDDEVASLTSYPIIRLVVEEQLANGA